MNANANTKLLLIESKEICRRLGISRPTFARMVADGRLPARKIGGRWKMRPEALDDFIDGKHETRERE